MAPKLANVFCKRSSDSPFVMPPQQTVQFVGLLWLYTSSKVSGFALAETKFNQMLEDRNKSGEKSMCECWLQGSGSKHHQIKCCQFLTTSPSTFICEHFAFPSIDCPTKKCLSSSRQMTNQQTAHMSLQVFQRRKINVKRLSP